MQKFQGVLKFFVLLNSDGLIPIFTTLCCQAKTLDVELRPFATTNQIHLVVDSTDLKVYGEGALKGECASTATRSGARGVKSISRSTRTRAKCMPR
ncbi:MAG: hypothetical protein E5299_01878 [Burkholderia gladioli]|nr:MAG: hypothetical protein E5299_01878 [Burkholderia gladioli]